MQPSESDPLLPSQSQEVTSSPVEVATYKRRWYILLLFSLMAATQGLNWSTWGPIAASAKFAYGWNNAMISLLAAWGPVFFMGTVFPFSWLMTSKGLRWASLITAGFVALGTGLRCITQTPPLATWLINLGQICVSIAGPVSMAGATVISATWFPAEQRLIATAIASRLMAIGGGLQFILGPLSVRDVEQNKTDLISNSSSLTPIDIRRDISLLMYVECGWACLIFLLMLVYFPAKPPCSPSVSVAIRQVNFGDGLKQLIRKGNFWLLALPYSTAYGMYIGWFACLDINMQKFNIDQKDAGYLGFYGIIAGTITALCMARLVDLISRRIKPFILALYIVACGGQLVFALVCDHIIPYTKVSLYVSRIVSAMCMSAMVPLVFETLCESAYPVPEAVTNGLLTLLKNFWCLVFLGIVWIPDISTEWMNWLLVGASAACVPMVILYKETHNRLDIDLDRTDQPGYVQAQDT